MARQCSHGWVGTEHVLWAMARAHGSVPGQCLQALGADEEAVRRAALAQIDAGRAGAAPRAEDIDARVGPFPPLKDAPRVGIIVAAPEEQAFFAPGERLLQRMGCPYDLIVVTIGWLGTSAGAFLEKMEAQGWGVVIVAAGLEPQAPSFLAHLCHLPVIALPLEMGVVERAHTLHLVLHSMGGAPVALVPPNAAREAALLAMRILAQGEPELAERLAMLDRTRRALLAPRWPDDAAEEGGPPSESAAEAPRAEAPAPESEPMAPHPSAPSVRIRPAPLDRPLEGTPVAPARTPPAPPPARRLGVRAIDGDSPDALVIEEAVDCLLEGGVIALPTETVYGIAVDATNPAAAERLYRLKGRPPEKAITLLIDSPKMLASIACNLTVEIRRLMEAFWPGPLTMIFTKRGQSFEHISRGRTIGVRLPDHPVPLALIQALARPLACTSANRSGEPDARSIDEVRAAFGDALDCLLDAGQLPPAVPSTVLDVTGATFRILRRGPVTYEQLAAVVGDKVEPIDGG